MNIRCGKCGGPCELTSRGYKCLACAWDRAIAKQDADKQEAANKGRRFRHIINPDEVFGTHTLLQDACGVGRRRPDLADATIAAHRRRFERELEWLLALKPTDAEERKLRDTVYVDCSDKLFVFLKRRDVEADQQRKRAGTEAIGDLPQSHKRVPLRVGRANLRRPLLKLSKPAAATAGTAIRDALA
jgi:hypothetical protein